MNETSPAETWDAFFSDFYLRAFSDDVRDRDAQEQALAAARLARCPEGGDVLDAPCGFGRHSIPLARAGYRVVGADRSAVLLEEARRRSGGERRPKFVQADCVAQMTQTLVPGNGARESRTTSLRVYPATELLAMLDRAGFSEAKCHGDLDGGPFEVATRLVIVARR